MSPAATRSAAGLRAEMSSVRDSMDAQSPDTTRSGRDSAAGSKLVSTACALVPPNPKALTPTTSRRSAGSDKVSVTGARFNAARSIAGFAVCK